MQKFSKSFSSILFVGKGVFQRKKSIGHVFRDIFGNTIHHLYFSHFSGVVAVAFVAAAAAVVVTVAAAVDEKPRLKSWFNYFAGKKRKTFPPPPTPYTWFYYMQADKEMVFNGVPCIIQGRIHKKSGEEKENGSFVSNRNCMGKKRVF